VIDTHIDGVGANTRPTGGKEVPTFPNARYVIAPEEIAALRAGRFPGAEPYQVLLDEGLVDEAGGPIVGEVATEPAPGHSTGHRVVRIGPEGRDAVVVGRTG
jgi:glyoxylase-like metal-dependent hydrolase (beta-lactamase superfamily II)